MDTPRKASKQPPVPLNTNPPFGYFPSAKTAAGRDRLRKIVEDILESTARAGNPEKGYAIKQMYEQSLSNPQLADLMDVVLSKKATAEQFAQFQAHAKDLHQANKKIPVPGVATYEEQVQSGKSTDAMGEGGSSAGGGGTRDDGMTVVGTQQGTKRLWEELLTTDEDTDPDSGSAISNCQKVSAQQNSAAMGTTTSGTGPKKLHKSVSELNAGSGVAQSISALRIDPGAMSTTRKSKHTYARNQEARTKDPRSRSRSIKETHSRLTGSPSYIPTNGSLVEGDRASKRQKMIGGTIVQQQPGRQGEQGKATGKEVDPTPSIALLGDPVAPLVVTRGTPQGRPDMPLIIEGCLKKSVAIGYATVGHAIQKYNEESLSDPLKGEILIKILDRTATPEQVLSFQWYIRDYYRSHKDISPGTTGPATTANDSPLLAGSPQNSEGLAGYPTLASRNVTVAKQYFGAEQGVAVTNTTSTSPQMELTPEVGSPQTPPDFGVQGNADNFIAPGGIRLPSSPPVTTDIPGLELSKSSPSSLGLFGSPDAPVAAGFGFGGSSLPTSLIPGLSVQHDVSSPPLGNSVGASQISGMSLPQSTADSG